jgi:hypothetical protein
MHRSGHHTCAILELLSATNHTWYLLDSLAWYREDRAPLKWPAQLDAGSSTSITYMTMTLYYRPRRPPLPTIQPIIHASQSQTNGLLTGRISRLAQACEAPPVRPITDGWQHDVQAVACTCSPASVLRNRASSCTSAGVKASHTGTCQAHSEQQPPHAHCPQTGSPARYNKVGIPSL